MTPASTKQNFMRSINGGIAVIALICWTMMLITCLWNLDVDIVPNAVTTVQESAMIAGGFIFLISAILIFVERRSRILHLSLLIIFFFVCWITLWSDRRHVWLRRQWFVHDGIKRYELIVETVKTGRFLLTDKPQVLITNKIPQGWVCARTNKDGSVTVWITPRDNNPRLGYIYSSGPLLTVDPYDSNNASFYHLTNGWYEF